MAVQTPRLWPVAILLVLVTGCAPRIPSAARLVFASPAPDAVIGTLPKSLLLHFSEDLDQQGSSADLLDSDGQGLASRVSVDPSDKRVLQVDVSQRDITGRLTVHWQTLSSESRTPAQGGFAFTVDPTAHTQPSLTVSPSLTDVGQPLTISGSGFGPRTPITLSVGDDAEPLGSAQTDASGAFVLTQPLPADVPFGTQPISAADEFNRRAAASVDVRWGGWPPVRVYTQATPGPGSGEVTFTVVGRNRSDYVLDGVRISLDIPTGASLVSASDGAQSQAGLVSWDQGVLDRTSLMPRRAVVSAVAPVVGQASIEFRHRRASGCIGDQCLPAFVDQTDSMSGLVTPAP